MRPGIPWSPRPFPTFSPNTVPPTPRMIETRSGVWEMSPARAIFREWPSASRERRALMRRTGSPRTRRLRLTRLSIWVWSGSASPVPRVMRSTGVARPARLRACAVVASITADTSVVDTAKLTTRVRARGVVMSAQPIACGAPMACEAQPYSWSVTQSHPRALVTPIAPHRNAGFSRFVRCSGLWSQSCSTRRNVAAYATFSPHVRAWYG